MAASKNFSKPRLFFFRPRPPGCHHWQRQILPLILRRSRHPNQAAFLVPGETHTRISCSAIHSEQ